MSSYYKGNAKAASLLSVLRLCIDGGAFHKFRSTGEGASWRGDLALGFIRGCGTVQSASIEISVKPLLCNPGISAF